MKSVDQYISVFEHNADAIAIANLDDIVIRVNSAFTKMFGYDISNINSSSSVFFKGIDDGMFAIWIEKCRANEGIKSYFTKRRTITGIELDVSVTISPLYNCNNELNGLIFYYRDITDLIVVRNKLYYQSLILKNLSDAIITTDNNLIITSWNEEAENFYLWKSSEAIGQNLDTLLMTFFCDITRVEAQNYLNEHGYWKGDVRQRKKSGEFVFVNATVSYFKNEQGEIIGGISHNRDITERKLTEQYLANSELEKTTILDNHDFNVVLQDKENKIIWLNQVAANSANKTKDDIIGKKCYEIWGYKNGTCDNCPVVKAIQSGKPESYEVSYPNGQYWKIKGVPIYDSNDILMHIIEIAENITDKKLAEIRIIESEEKYRSLIECAPVGIGISKNQDTVFANKKLLEIFGYNTFEEMLVVPRLTHIHPEDIDYIKKKQEQFSKETNAMNLTINYRIINNLGLIKHLFVTTSVVQINSVSYYQGIFLDQTENIELKEDLRLLSEKSIYANEKNKIIEEFNNLFDEITQNYKISKSEVEKYQNILKKYYQPEDDWKVTKIHFEAIHRNFYSNLKKLHPDLTQNELRHITYIKMNYSTKEIARIFSVAPESIQKARVRLKKKLELSVNDDLYLYIQDF